MSGKISYKCRNYPTCLFWQDKGPNEECEWCARNPKEEE
jgi:ssDNA-binding Zn-finger/Zn-ribbon topoisomerase 1